MTPGPSGVLTRTIHVRASAKINLALHVVGRRADSYHLLDSIAVFADFADRVTVEPAAHLSLTTSGPFAAHAPADPSDLAWRAAEAFFKHCGRPPGAAVHVEKSIPAGAGLGGGSADAAAVLTALNEGCGAGLSPKALSAIGLSLGADVPMCLVGQALRAQGVGEVIDVLDGWRPLPTVLVWPGETVSTAAVFAALASRENPPLPSPAGLSFRDASPAAMAGWLSGCRNDLEAPAVVIAPEIGAVLEALRQDETCLLARMSGSGSACFGLYADQPAAQAAAARLEAVRPHWWVRAVTAR